MTLLAYRPELAIALADDSGPSGVSQAVRDELRRIENAMRNLVALLTQVQSLSAAEVLAASIAPAYIELATQWGRTRLQDRESVPEANTRNPLFEDIHRSDMIPEDTKETLYGALESSVAYFAWIHRNYATLMVEERQHVTEVLEQVGYDIAGVEATLVAVGLTIKGVPGSDPQAIPPLAELVDRCWTEVEDVFLSLAKHEDDDGGTVPLSEVKAELGL